jgi:hypothetical protein
VVVEKAMKVNYILSVNYELGETTDRKKSMPEFNVVVDLRCWSVTDHSPTTMKTTLLYRFDHLKKSGLISAVIQIFLCRVVSKSFGQHLQ